MNKTSMLYWWPKVKELGIPVPKTEIVEIPFDHLIGLLDGESLPDEYKIRLVEVGRLIGYPLFLRTDMSSAKHQWERTCFVPDESNLFRRIWSLIDNTLASGMFGELDPNALVFRQYIRLYSTFTAFNGLPISRERRYFIRDGKVECHHPYWIEDAIKKGWPPPDKRNWNQLLVNLNWERKNEIRLLSSYGQKVGTVLEGYWSVDFAYSYAGWYLIDMAEGEKSWHPQHVLQNTLK